MRVSLGLLLAGAICAEANEDDSWWDGFGPAGKGLDNRAVSFAEYQDRLVVGGSFTRAGNNLNAKHIGRFNGTRWAQLAGGTDGQVAALSVQDGVLYAGGGFTTAGGNAAQYIASWNGSSWSTLGAGMNDAVAALTVFSGDLAAGGYFTTAGGTSANLVATWDGSAWAALGSGLGGGASPFVQALAEFNGELYAGGSFTDAGGTVVTHLARWNGTAWGDFGVNLVPGTLFNVWPVHVLLTDYAGALVVGGGFTHIGGVFANGIAMWDGVSWTGIGAGLSAPANVVGATVYHGDLIAFGYFNIPGGGTNVARWNGSSWSSLGSGVSAFDPSAGHGAAAVFEEELYVGGNVGLAGGKLSFWIARWRDPATAVPPIALPPAGVSLAPPTPNPSRGHVVLSYTTHFASPLDISVFDVTGRRIRRLVRAVQSPGSYELVWESVDDLGRPIPAGTYVVRLVAGGEQVSRRVTLVR